MADEDADAVKPETPPRLVPLKAGDVIGRPKEPGGPTVCRPEEEPEEAQKALPFPTPEGEEKPPDEKEKTPHQEATMRNILQEACAKPPQPPQVIERIKNHLKAIKICMEIQENPGLNKAKKEGAQKNTFKRIAESVAILGDEIALLETAIRSTLVCTNGDAIQFIMKRDGMLRQETQAKLDQYTTALTRLNDRFNRLESDNTHLEHNMRALFYAACERGVFATFEDEELEWLEGASEEEQRERLFQKNYQAFQEMALRIFPERLGIEKTRGAFESVRLIGQPFLSLFNMELDEENDADHQAESAD